jgi:hypothetical protein
MGKQEQNNYASDADRLYEESVRKIQNAVKSMTFGQAVKLVEIEDENVKRAVIDDALKVLIAEMHFTGGKPLKELAKKLKVPLSRLETSKAEMLDDVRAAAIEAAKNSSFSGNA